MTNRTLLVLALLTIGLIAPPNGDVELNAQTISSCWDCARKIVPLTGIYAALCCKPQSITTHDCDLLDEQGWTIFDKDLVTCTIVTRDEKGGDYCIGQRCSSSGGLCRGSIEASVQGPMI